MSQDEINRLEWENPDNWSGPDWAAIYFSKQDSRSWVLKKVPRMGWTLNLGTRAGVFWLIAIMGGLPGLIVLVGVVLFFSFLALGN